MASKYYDLLVMVSNKWRRIHQIIRPNSFEVFTLGRVNESATSNFLVLSSPEISRRHAELLFLDGRFYLRDLQSTNKTRIRGEDGDIEVGNTSFLDLSLGQIFSLGTVLMQIVEAEDEQIGLPNESPTKTQHD